MIGAICALLLFVGVLWFLADAIVELWEALRNERRR